MSYQLDPISWEAAAGFAAVIAALRVGVLQIKIVRRQTDIQETTLRATLFERRWQIYDAASIALDHAVGRRQYDEYNKPQDVLRAFSLAVQQSQFLFDAQIEERLRQTYEAADAYFLRGVFPGKYLNARQLELVAEYRQELLGFLKERSDNLPELFGGELRLGGQIGLGSTNWRALPLADYHEHPDWIAAHRALFQSVPDQPPST